MLHAEGPGVRVLGPDPLIVTLPFELKDDRIEELRVGVAEEERDALGEAVVDTEAVDVRDARVEPLYVVELLTDLVVEAEIVSDELIVCAALPVTVAVEQRERAEVLLPLSDILAVFCGAPLALCVGEPEALFVARIVVVPREEPVYVRLDKPLADALFVAVGVREDVIDRVPVGQLVLVFEACMLRVSVLVPSRTVPVAKGVPVLVLEAFGVVLCVMFAVAVFDRCVDAETLEEPLDVFDAETVLVVVRLIAGVDVERTVLDIVALPEEVREALKDSVWELLAVGLLLLLAERLCDGLLLLVLLVVTVLVVVFDTKGVRVPIALAVTVLVRGPDGLLCAEADDVFEDVTLRLSNLEARGVYVFIDVGVTLHVGGALLVPVVVFVDVLERVVDCVGTTALPISCLSTSMVELFQGVEATDTTLRITNSQCMMHLLI